MSIKKCKLSSETIESNDEIDKLFMKFSTHQLLCSFYVLFCSERLNKHEKVLLEQQKVQRDKVSQEN